MRVVVIGATGNLGTATVRRLVDDPGIDEVVGVARRLPAAPRSDVHWVAADITRDDLTNHLKGADAVVLLAWAIQPARRQGVVERTNVEGSLRVADAMAAAGVPALAYASSVGAYSPGPKDRPVDEHWPTDGVQTSFYGRHKAAVEHGLDRFEAAHPDVRVVRLRPGLVFQRAAATEIRRLFAGPLLPGRLLRPGLIPVLPVPAGLAFQAVHADDVADAFARAILDREAAGAFNVAADPVIGAAELGAVLRARTVTVPAAAVRALADLSWRARLQPTPPGWLDLALEAPTMSTTRARDELGWSPARSSSEALADLLGGLRDGDGYPTPPLVHDSLPGRARELAAELTGGVR